MLGQRLALMSHMAERNRTSRPEFGEIGVLTLLPFSLRSIQSTGVTDWQKESTSIGVACCFQFCRIALYRINTCRRSFLCRVN